MKSVLAVSSWNNRGVWFYADRELAMAFNQYGTVTVVTDVPARDCWHLKFDLRFDFHEILKLMDDICKGEIYPTELIQTYVASQIVVSNRDDSDAGLTADLDIVVHDQQEDDDLDIEILG